MALVRAAVHHRLLQLICWSTGLLVPPALVEELRAPPIPILSPHVDHPPAGAPPHPASMHPSACTRQHALMRDDCRVRRHTQSCPHQRSRSPVF